MAQLAAMTELTPRVVRPPIAPARRFQIPDLDQHAIWFLPRFMAQFPHLNQRQAVGFLRSVVYSNEFLFLYQDRAIGLAQAVSEHTLQPHTIIWERFVFCEDKSKPDQLEQAASFYDEIARWARTKHVEQIVVDQCTDVPREKIKEKLGQIRLVEMVIARS